MPAGPPDWARVPAENPFAAYPNGVLGVPAHQPAPPQGAARQPKLTAPGSASALDAAARSWSRLPPTAPLWVPQTGPTAPAQPEWPGSDDRPLAGVPSWAQLRTIDPATAFPKPFTQNLTEQALRARGVPEPDIAAAIGNPERMKQLIYQTFGAGSARAPAATDDLWSGRARASPIVMAPPAGQSKMLEAVQTPFGNPFAAHPNGVRVPGGSTAGTANSGPGSPQAADPDALWSGRAPAAPPVMAPLAGQPTIPGAVQSPAGNPFAAYPGSVRGVPGQLFGRESDRASSATPPTFSSTAPKPTPDKYRQAAIDELARLRQAGAPMNEYEKRLLHGYSIGADNTVMAAALAPIEAYRHGINPQEDYKYFRALWEGYKYAKAREDLLDEESRKNTGNLGSGLEAIGRGARQGDLERKFLATLFRWFP
jgi:hypothetical protein